MLKQLLLEVFRDIALDKPGARWIRIGICYCAITAIVKRAKIDGRDHHDEAQEVREWMEETFAGMGLDRQYPVKHPTMPNSRAYNSDIPFWTGEYGVNRLHLLNLLIIKLQAEIAAEKV